IDVTHLVDINGNDKAERELPAPDVPIDPKVEKHRKKGARFGETEEKELGFGEKKEGNEFEFPDKQADGAEDAAAVGPLRLVRCFGGGWIFEALDEIVYFGVDGQVLS